MDEQTPPVACDEMRDHTGSGLLNGKVALVTGGDSVIGRAVCIAFAKEGADVAISYTSEAEARRTADLVEAAGARVLLLPGDVDDRGESRMVVQRAVARFGKVDVLVNHATSGSPVSGRFTTNVEATRCVTQATLPHMPEGSAVINTAAVTGRHGHPSTKAAVVSLTHSLAMALADRNIRVNAVAHGPVWTVLIPATFPHDKVTLLRSVRPGVTDEIASPYVFFASDHLSSSYSGEVLVPIGGHSMPG